MREIKTNKIFFSVFQSDASEELNLNNHYAIKDLLTLMGIPLIEVNGMYGGIKEKSFLILESDYDKFLLLTNKVKSIASDYRQESVLTVENDDKATLYYLSGEVYPIGTFREVTEDEAKNVNSYSEINGRFFIID